MLSQQHLCQKYQNWLMCHFLCVEVIVYNISVIFETQYSDFLLLFISPYSANYFLFLYFFSLLFKDVILLSLKVLQKVQKYLLFIVAYVFVSTKYLKFNFFTFKVPARTFTFAKSTTEKYSTHPWYNVRVISTLTCGCMLPVTRSLRS